MITKFTFTGADHSVDPQDLAEISQEFPFVEWGILVMPGQFGSPRFPGLQWIEKLSKIKNLNLSMHLCGRYVKSFMHGDMVELIETVPLFAKIGLFNRVQINTHGFKHDFKYEDLVQLIINYPEKEFIFQYDNENQHILNAISREARNISTLFDLSHGAGVLPEKWPDPIDGISCGYAGGLSPKNLKEQIVKIEAAAGDREIWIDIETHVRSYSDKTFDLDKVKECCWILQNHFTSKQ